jgi:hypothetical protein
VSLAFLSPSSSAGDLLASPLRRALDTVSDTVSSPETDGKGDSAHQLGIRGLRDLSLDGKVELRGDLDLVEPEPGEELIRLSPRRAYLLVDGDPRDVVARLRGDGVRAYDMTGALAGLAFEGERVARRLTDLDLDGLPAAGMFAKIGALLVRDEGERFRAYFPQELGHYVAECVLDAIAGLENR